MAVCYILHRRASKSPVWMDKLRGPRRHCGEMNCALGSVSYVRSSHNPAHAVTYKDLRRPLLRCP